MLEFKHAEMKIQSVRGVRGKGSVGLLPMDGMMSEVTSLLGISALTSVKWESLGPRMWLRECLPSVHSKVLSVSSTHINWPWLGGGSEVQGHP